MKTLFLVILLLLASCGGEDLFGETFYDLNGKEVKLPEGRPLLLYVWTGTCVGHGEDLRFLSENYERISRKYAVVSLAVFMEPRDVREYLKENNLNPPFPMYTDPTGKLEKHVKLLFLPATLLFDEKGRLVGNYPRIPREVSDLAAKEGNLQAQPLQLLQDFVSSKTFRVF